MKAFRRAIERDAQPIHQVDDLRPPIGHFLDRRLMLQKVAAVDRVVEVQPLAVALLPRHVVDAVDAALSADAVRALDRDEAHQIDVDAELGQLHRGRQPGQSAADDHHALLCHLGRREQGSGKVRLKNADRQNGASRRISWSARGFRLGGFLRSFFVLGHLVMVFGDFTGGEFGLEHLLFDFLRLIDVNLRRKTAKGAQADDREQDAEDRHRR